MMIAIRVLKLFTGDSSVEIPIRLYAPRQDGNPWRSRYEIDWPEGRETREAWGCDSVQALVLALQMIGADIYTSSYHQSGRLMFERRGGGYGFPVPASLRSLCEGDDANADD